MLNKIKKTLYPYAKALALKFVAPVAAKRLWKKIRERKDPNTMIFISVFAIGDILYCLSLAKEIKRANPEKKIVVIAIERFKNLVESFGSFDQAVFIPNTLWGGSFAFSLKVLLPAAD